MFAYAVHMYTFSPVVTPDLPPYTMDQPLLAVPRREQSVHHSCTWPHPGNPWSHSLLPVVKNINCSMPGYKYSSISCASFFYTDMLCSIFLSKYPVLRFEIRISTCPLCENSLYILHSQFSGKTFNF